MYQSWPSLNSSQGRQPTPPRHARSDGNSLTTCSRSQDKRKYRQPTNTTAFFFGMWPHPFSFFLNTNSRDIFQMAQPVLRVFKGLFKCEQVFDQTKYEFIYGNLQGNVENGEFSTRRHVHDQGFENHPLWLEKFDFSIEKDILNHVNSTDIPRLFGFENTIPVSDVSASFVLLYTQNESKCNQVALKPHQDVSLLPNKHILSVVYTIKSIGCVGGSLAYSHKWNGEQQYLRDLTSFNPKNNSIYCFNGDYVSHMVYGVDVGCRFAVVLFINSPQTDLDVAMLWQYPN
jgi:hypothetical protein